MSDDFQDLIMMIQNQLTTDKLVANLVTTKDLHARTANVEYGTLDTTRADHIISKQVYSNGVSSNTLIVTGGATMDGTLTTRGPVTHTGHLSTGSATVLNGLTAASLTVNGNATVAAEISAKRLVVDNEIEADMAYLGILDCSGAVTATSFIGNLNAANIVNGIVAIDHLPDASTAAAGIVRLEDSVLSTSTTTAVTARVANVLQNQIDEVIPTKPNQLYIPIYHRRQDLETSDISAKYTIIQCERLYYYYDENMDWTNLTPCFTSTDGRQWKPYGDVYVEHFGAVADGEDNFSDGTQKYSYKSRVQYEVGDLIQWRGYDLGGGVIGTVGLRCNTAHLSTNTLDMTKFDFGQFAGTDNYTAFDNAIKYVQAVLPDPVLHFSNGKYKVSKSHAAASTITFKFIYGKSLSLIGTSTELLLEEDATTVYNGYPAWFGHVESQPESAEEDTPIGVGGVIKIKGLHFRSIWSHYPNNSGTNSQGVNVFRTLGLEEFVVQNCAVSDWRTVGFMTINANRSNISHSRFTRCCKDQCRHWNVNDVTVTNCRFQSVDDDPISWASSPNSYSNKPTSMKISHNTFIDTESLYIGHAKIVKVTNNYLHRCKGGIHVGRIRPRDRILTQFERHDTSSFSIIIENNTIASSIERWDNVPNSNSLQTVAAPASSYLTVATPEPSADPYPTQFDVTNSKFILPYDSLSSVGPGFYYTDGSNRAGDPVVGPGSIVSVQNNHLIRDMRFVSNFSDLGFGEMFSWEGWLDPEITADVFKPIGIAIQSFIHNFVVKNNVIQNMIEDGIKLLFVDPASYTSNPWHKQFHNGEISHNNIVNCQTGITHNKITSASSTTLQSLSIHHNYIDLDPYHLHPDRNGVSGAWNVPASVVRSAIGINMYKISGVVISKNNLRNCYLPIHGKDCLVMDNIVYCEPVSRGYDASNKGCGALTVDDAPHNYIIVDSTPGSTDYNKVKNVCYTFASTVPTTGTWVAGHIVKNTNYNSTTDLTREWHRLTTGSAHILDTDWKAIQ